MIGLIVMHCLENMRTSIEEKVFDNIKHVLHHNQHTVLGTRLERKDVRDLVSNCADVDLMQEHNKPILKDWIVSNDIDSVFIMGLHYNLCVRQLESRLFEISREIGKRWGNDFRVNVLEECTAVIHDGKVLTMQEYARNHKVTRTIKLEQWMNTL